MRTPGSITRVMSLGIFFGVTMRVTCSRFLRVANGGWDEREKAVTPMFQLFVVGMRQAFSLRMSFVGYEPRALPWAGMKQAFGLRRRFFGYEPRRCPEMEQHKVPTPRGLLV